MVEGHTLVHQLESWARQKPSVPAIHGRKPEGGWRSFTWAEYWRAVRETAKGLIALGHKPGEAIALVGDNRPEWVICQFGMQAARGLPAPIYTTNTAEMGAYIVNNAMCRIAICDKQEQLDKYLVSKAAGDIQVDTIIIMDELGDYPEGVMSLTALRKLGREQDDAELDKRLSELQAEETAQLIYTSGTTGEPKGVEIDHRGMVLVGQELMERGPFKEPGAEYRVMSYLPLCHQAEQIFTNILSLATGGEVYFWDDIKLLKDGLLAVRPTVFLGVPRVWEKFEAALTAGLEATTGLKSKLASWARKTELEAFRKRVATGQDRMGLQRRLAEKLVIGKLKKRLGLEKLIIAATGSAPIGARTLEFFAALGVVIVEGYGLSETSGVAFTTDFRQPRFGTVGKAFSCVDVKLAEDGEVLLRGPIMTKGYFNMPEKTAELYDADGWLQTGDLGELDEEGNLKITGRKKDLIITAGGKNIAPLELESYIDAIPGVGKAVVVGDRKPYLAALLVLDVENLTLLAKEAGTKEASLPEMAADPKVREFIDGKIEEVCNSKVARVQKVRRFAILPNEFSLETGELTPTQKVKRNIVVKQYAAEIEGIYEASAASV